MSRYDLQLKASGVSVESWSSREVRVTVGDVQLDNIITEIGEYEVLSGFDIDLLIKYVEEQGYKVEEV
jgi:hypothetical protein